MAVLLLELKKKKKTYMLYTRVISIGKWSGKTGNLKGNDYVPHKYTRKRYYC